MPVSQSWDLGTAPVGYTGKLPHYGDFVRQNVISSAAKAFEAWQAEGLTQFPAKAGNGWERSFDSAAPFFFLFHGGERNNFAVGASIPSRDKSGRRYPFTIFSTSPAGSQGELYYLLPSACASFLTAARQTMGEEWPPAVDAVYGRKIAPLVSTLPHLSPELNKRFEQYVETTTLKDFFTSLFGSFEAPEKYLVMDNLLKTLIPLRGRDSGRFNFSLRLPLASLPGEEGMQIGFWTVLCHKILGYAFPPAYLFWASSEAGGALFLFFRTPEARFFTYLLVPELNNDLVWNLSALGKEKLNRNKLPAPLVKLLDSPDEKLKTLLNVKDWERSYSG